ncbi:MAG: hypothetical protein A3F31_03730 [Candidatus Levybacteria bacterium RIFCSPHIGHO2_12_FULL_38_12]|nr:MAG: hypothetical protein A2770_02125 [Candidatus Levybacteria bacterium RIFCSPHIGHO2_01_FULL_38_12]OGH21876.1 MAG: hypothetical protein A3D75_00345 [Candidatus Levybacteria bacterium RIFCSPHIGHO2_02_FULL_37_18]OGH22808.1 MAG: hypothetical protein A3F31_03730 [Candidatus Levybacteria bacterium RIFCSPHIGHO2_12_FULL_38_12]OGH33533.1 MAG: hypothetical protein A3A47_01690 [Candidatus Levybacteria bacterium RIFCSPLOWO2_01_FULL_37_20]OGH44454.1 MAG: hypothetical protein A3J14_03380 [Candidatus Lev
MNSFEQIFMLVAQVPKGKVITYKLIAQKLNIKDHRFVGFALHRNKNPHQIPCHRVIKSNGELAEGYAFGGKQKQREMLKHEGVLFTSNYRVNLNQCLFMI